MTSGPNEIPLPEGWFNPTDCEGYRMAISRGVEHPDEPFCVLEIGNYMGRSTTVVFTAMQQCPRMHLIAVDPYYTGAHASPIEVLRAFHRLAMQYEVHHRVHFIHAPSEYELTKPTISKFLEALPSKHLDVVMIDANHTEQFVRHDIQLARSFISRNPNGGVICGHDANWDSVRNALIKEFGKGGYELVGRSFWIHRIHPS